MTAFIVATAIKVIVVVVAILTGCAYATWLERKFVGRLQHRIGPNLAGPFGLLQPIADAIKLAFKEDIVPNRVEKVTYFLAPIVSFIPAMLSFAVIPFGNTITIMGQQIDMVISDLNIGILFIFAVTSLGVYGIVLAGWSSGSKYSLLGGIRSSAQMISYEIAYGLSIIGVLVIAQTLSLKELVAQQEHFFDWYIFRQPLGFVLFVICGIAETNRSPFDLAEAESELVAGYLTEYSSLRYAMFFIGEYANMIAVSSVVTTIFLGGWQGPFLPPVVWFCIKVFLFMAFYVWVRGTLPRIRYDQLMNLGWKVLFPLALFNVLVTALIYRL
ncbi:MAG: NADH-quinone oxidoreductase subunit NuoH [candidate division Zixibacteria bacterium HGW-Zixibacteria-1]|nr:MAG: NADH-quinone oxidoreductase subunit NuoH [candidate division Zixibacteria bacterium HGW-Zixibacteria-1]